MLAGGNSDLVNKFKGGKLEVCGGYERVQAVTKLVKQDDVIQIGGIKVTCIATPCHTSGHICYFATKPGSGLDPCVFTGGLLLRLHYNRLHYNRSNITVKQQSKLKPILFAIQIPCFKQAVESFSKALPLKCTMRSLTS